MSKLFLAAILVLMAGGAQATTYTYTGVNFDAASSPYTTAMSVSGSITLASPLAANLVGHDLLASLTAWSFSTGVQTYSSAAPPPYKEVIVSTHADGTIADWFMRFTNAMDQSLVSCGVVGSGATLGVTWCGYEDSPAEYDWVSEGPDLAHASSAHAGSWSQIPEPSTGLLVTLGLTRLAAKGRRRNRS